MNKRMTLSLIALAKVPFLVYLVISIIMVPGIDAVKYNSIPGAHRGESVLYLENTLPAIKAALENESYKFIEFDIQYTEDKKIVLFHDKTLLRMQGKFPRIADFTYEELQEFSDYEIPLYEDVMDIIGKKTKINIEIKSSGDFEADKELVDFVVQDAKNRDVLKNIMISSISGDVVKYVNENYPKIKTGQIFLVTYSTFMDYEFLTEWLYETVEETGADYVMLHGININNIESLIKLKPEGKTLAFWYFTNEMYIVQVDKSDKMW